MNRKLVATLVVLAVAALIISRIVRGHGDAAPTVADHPRSAAIKPTITAKPDEPVAPRGIAPRWSLDLDPEGPLRLEGQVVGPDGRGIAGATVWLGSVPPRKITTEDDGSFGFDKLVGRTYSISAATSSLVGGPVTYKLTRSSDPVVIRLSEGAALAVKVSDEAAHAIAGAEVKLVAADDRHATTDDHGKASLKPIRPGWVEVEVTAAGYAQGNAITTLGSAGAAGELSVTLHKGVRVSGRVIDDAGKPIAKVRISVTDQARWGGAHGGDEVDTDAKGQFTFAALAPGTHTLAAADGEHEPTTSTPVTVTADHAVTNLEIKMKAGGTLSGTVVDPNGKPARFATVRVAGSGARMWSTASRQATTDERGQFELRGLTHDKLQARAESDNAASKIADVDLVAHPAIKDLRLVLDVQGTISGTVVDDTGQPVTEVTVNAFPDVLGGGSVDGFALAGLSSALTDGAGGFAIHGLPDGQYRLWAARDTGQSGGWGEQSTPAKAGDTTVRIVLAAPGGVIGNIVLDTGAAPILANVTVGTRTATPAAAGAFQIKDVQPGTYDITLRGPEFVETVQHDITIAPGKTTDLGTISVARGRKLVGRVVDATGSPVAGASVRLGEMLISSNGDTTPNASIDDISGIRSTTTDQDGGFTLVGVPVKATNVMASDPNQGQSLATPVAAGRDDPPSVTLKLRGFGSITGLVTMKGEPQSGVTVSESSQGAGVQASFAQTGADGTFAMTKVAEGVHVLNAMQSQMLSMKSTSATVTVVAGKTSSVTIDIPVGTITVSVQVQPMPNNEVDAAQVFLFRGTVSATNGKQVTDGFFQGATQGMKFWFGVGKPAPEFDEVVPGAYTVCTIPITGDLSDPTFQQRLQQNSQTLMVYCKPVAVAASPLTQTVIDQVPAMTPLPNPKT